MSGLLPPESDAVTYDLILINAEEAAEVLGLEPHHVSDIVVWVFHDSEEVAIRGDLERSMPWTVRITGRAEATEALLATLGHRSGLGVASLIPAILALVLLTIVVGRQGRGGRLEVALLKILGWTTTDVVGLRLLQIGAIGFPSVVAGLAVAFSLVIWPGAPSILDIFIHWQGPPPSLSLDASGAMIVLAVVSGVVLVPLVGAALWPAVRSATVDSGELLQEVGEP